MVKGHATAIRSWLVPLLVITAIFSGGLVAIRTWWSLIDDMQSSQPAIASSSPSASTVAPSTAWSVPKEKQISPTAGAPLPQPVPRPPGPANPTGAAPLPLSTVVPPPSEAPQPLPGPVVEGAMPVPPNAFEQVSNAMAGLITANASWHRPENLTVEESQLIGLEIGQSDAVAARISELLPNTVQSPAGSVAVNSNVRARLIANPNDAEVFPNESLNASTPSDISLLWTWNVRPKRTTESLLLTAHIEVPIAGGNTLSTDIPLHIPVRETPSHWLSQVSNWISSHWAMLAGIVAVAGAVAAWWRKRTLKAESASSPASLSGGHASSSVGSAASTDPVGLPTTQGNGGATRAAETQPR
jgi:hypothetical protein